MKRLKDFSSLVLENFLVIRSSFVGFSYPHEWKFFLIIFPLNSLLVLVFFFLKLNSITKIVDKQLVTTNYDTTFGLWCATIHAHRWKNL